MKRALVLALLLGAIQRPAVAQQAPGEGAYADAVAEEMVRLARLRRSATDSRITRYQVTAHERISASIVVAGFEKLLFRRETAAQIDWGRDTVRVEVLGAREAQPFMSAEAQLPPPDIAGTVWTLAFDPMDPEVLLRLDSTAIWHPLTAGSEANYRFASGETTSIQLPDGRVVRLLELLVTARRRDPRLINGSLWLDEETHGMVRAVVRLSQPLTTATRVYALLPEARAEIDHIAIDYGLWSLRWWLPRSIVAEGIASLGDTGFSLAYERRYDDYRVEGDTLRSALDLEAQVERPCRPSTFGSIGLHLVPSERSAAWDAALERSAARLAADSISAEEERCNRAFLVTAAEPDLVNAPIFSGSVYQPGEAALTPAEREQLTSMLARIPVNPFSNAPPSLQVLTPPDLLRVNRVEGLSGGARATLPLGLLELAAELRAGTTGEIGVRLSGSRSTSRVRAEIAAYRGLEAVGVSSNPFSLSSSVGALLFGRDENDYFRGKGAELRLSPPASQIQRWTARLFAERQTRAAARSTFSVRGLFDDSAPRANVDADRVSQLGASVLLRGSAGSDPSVGRVRAELELHGESGDRTFVRPLLRLEADRLLGRGTGVGISLVTGSSWGDVTVQREWQIGGGETVRGHDPATLRGESLWLTRGELTLGPPFLRLSLFGDAGWAGPRAEFLKQTPISSVGVGATLLDNLLRLEVATGIGGGGTRVYLRLGGGL